MRMLGLGVRIAGFFVGSSLVALACTVRAPTHAGPSAVAAPTPGDPVPPMPTAGAAPAPTAHTDPGFQAGSRLRPRWQLLTAADGARARTFAGFWDAVLKTECTFVLAADGQQRCLPPRAEMGITPWYSDAACTRPMLSAAAADCVGLAPGRTIAVAASSSSMCAAPPVTQAFRVGAQIPGTPLVHRREGSSCLTVGTLVGNLRYFEATSIPLGDFLSATVSIE